MKKTKDTVKENEEPKEYIWVPLNIPDAEKTMSDEKKTPPHTSSGIDELDNAFKKAFKKKINKN